jgi:hypothetical protein
MWRSLFLLGTSLAPVLAGGCGDDNACGPGSAPAVGLAASSADVTLTYGNMTSRAGNDCPAAGAPAGVVSLSIEGMQTDGTGLVTFCIPRPDLLGAGGRTLGLTQSMADVRIIDVIGTANTCTFALDTSRPPSGTASGDGVCDHGTNAAGFALTVDGALSLRRTCGTTIDTVSVTLGGVVAVAAE